MTRRIPYLLRQVHEHFVAGNRVILLRDGAEAFPAMLEAIKRARRQVLLEMYWFDSDSTGQRFAEALGQAAERGIEVALCYDALGSLETDPAFFAALERRGVKTLEYNPIRPWQRRFRLERVVRRNHRKILVVDGKVGFTGGINLDDAWAPSDEGGAGWRDDMVCVRGPAVMGLMDCFLGTWRSEGGDTLVRFEGHEHETETEQPQAVQVLVQNSGRQRRAILRAYLHNIYRAAHRVWISNAYFLPHPKLVRALISAARRGVDVRVLLPAKSDVEVVRIASHAVWGRLLRAGVRLYEWHETVLHAKTAVIDGRWSTVGTFNLDYRSISTNLEVNLAVRDATFGRVVELSFERDLARSREVNARVFDRRGWFQRGLERLLYRFRKLL